MTRRHVPAASGAGRPAGVSEGSGFTPWQTGNARGYCGAMNQLNGVNHGATLKAEAGLWIDHREAFIVVLSKSGEATKRILSGVEKQARRAGEPATGKFENQAVAADDSRQREQTGHLARYYDEIVAYLREAGAVLIFGPGEAKGELKKRFDEHKSGPAVVTLETTDKMTEPQMVAYVRHHFFHEAARQGV